MKKKRIFYELEKLLKSDSDRNNQQSYMSSDSDTKQNNNNNVKENISNNMEPQITEKQKERRKKWIEELQGKTTEEKTSQKDKFDFSFSNGSNMQSSSKRQNKNQPSQSNNKINISSQLKTEDEQVSDILINMLIDKFLNQRFLSNDTKLNTRRNSFEPEYGSLKWNIPDLVRHKVTKDLNKMLYDKYGFNDKEGKGENIPLSFYFDLSGSMEEYSRFLSLVAIKLIRKDVKVLFGFNQKICYQIDSVPNTFTAEEFRKIISENLSYEQLISDPRCRNIKIKQVNEDIDKYLIEKKTQKSTIFSDFDAKKEIENLSKYCEIWWFCFEKRKFHKNTSVNDFKGHFYNIEKSEDFIKHLKNISSRVYEKRQRIIREGGIEL